MKKRLTLLAPIFIVVGLALVFSFSTRPEAKDLLVSGPKIGDMAPEISLASPDGKMIPLSSLRGKLVLIDFWASWCGPCRKENPSLVRTYEKFHTARFKNAKEFTIYSVSLDDNVDNWKAAIKKDKLVWENHVSDLMRWESPAARAYGVEAIPTNFLLDETGKVIAINLSSKELDNLLKSLQ